MSTPILSYNPQSRSRRLCWHSLVAGILTGMISAAAHAGTIVQIQTEHDNHITSEGYISDIDNVLSSIENARFNTDQTDNPVTLARHRWHSHDIQVTDVGTSVYSDSDRDGFFSHFSVSFDVDTDYLDTWIYARIYLRSDDSDYAIFHTTEVFEVFNDLASDSYKIDSKLVANYPAGYYDVRIEIYESSSDVLYDTVDASTHRTLFALPLEANIVDDGPSDSIVHGHVGSFGLFGLLALAVVACRRRL